MSLNQHTCATAYRDAVSQAWNVRLAETPDIQLRLGLALALMFVLVAFWALNSFRTRHSAGTEAEAA